MNVYRTQTVLQPSLGKWCGSILLLAVLCIFLNGNVIASEIDSNIEKKLRTALKAADLYRLPFEEGQMKVVMTTYQGNTNLLKQQSRFIVSVANNGDSLVEMLNPRVKGQKVLMTQHGMWLHVPSSRRMVRITPLQRLTGQANYGDIGRMQWDNDYRIHDVEEIKQTDKSPQQLKLILHAKSKSASYKTAHLWVYADSYRPIQAEFFLLSGKLFKRATFSKPVLWKGKRVIRSMEISDVSVRKEKNRTVIRVEDYKSVKLPRRFFTKRGLTHSKTNFFK